MGDVGDQLRFHPLALHLFLHGVLNALADVVQGFAVGAEGAVELFQRELVVQVPLGQLLAARLQVDQLQHQADEEDQLHDLQQKPQQCHPSPTVPNAQQTQQLQKAEAHKQQARLPEEGQLLHGLPNAPAHPAEEPAEGVENAAEEQVFTQRPLPPPADQGAEGGKEDKAAHQCRRDRIARHELVIQIVGECRRTAQQDDPGHDHQQVRGHSPVQPGATAAKTGQIARFVRLLLHARPNGVRPEQEEQAQQSQHTTKDRPGDQGAAVGQHGIEVGQRLIGVALIYHVREQGAGHFYKALVTVGDAVSNEAIVGAGSRSRRPVCTPLRCDSTFIIPRVLLSNLDIIVSLIELVDKLLHLPLGVKGLTDDLAPLAVVQEARF